MRRIFYCDFDGTIIHENSEVLFVKFLMQSGYFKIYHYIIAGIALVINAVRRLLGHGNIIKAWTFRLSDINKKELVNQFWDEYGEQINLNMSVISYLYSFDGEIVVLTGSDEILVEEFLKRADLLNNVHHVIGAQMGKEGLVVKRHPYGKDKCNYIEKADYILGIANEPVDQYFLSMCNEALIVKGSKKLERIAKEKNWSVI